ncbi:hypothetical protein K432DRAFT_17427 [Lepidopterella palustris CBS 459.81]|uniref:Apple domain-containing protein n=1 Tax=Lepidopterella palustris CBS 459.81 TaxID=1314670 RepID=A0A8E2JGF8_9PEZI|nr:hypothetical protein K432DRAFT_17427 [Lepidopterella palustris CBS 459.81]
MSPGFSFSGSTSSTPVISSTSIPSSSASTPVSSAYPNGISASTPSCSVSDGFCFVVNSAIYRISCFSDDYGDDLSLTWEPTFQSCLTTCSTTTGCIDVSYIPASGNGDGPCYMKSNIQAAKPDASVWCARLAFPAVTSTISNIPSTFLVKNRAAATILAKRQGLGPNYTYPPILTTTITNGITTTTMTITPSASGLATSTTYILASISSTATPAASGVSTSIITTASTSTTTVVLSATVETITVSTKPTGYTTMTPVNSGIASTTVTAEAYTTSTVYVPVTAVQTTTISVSGCSTLSQVAASESGSLITSDSAASSYVPVVPFFSHKYSYKKMQATVDLSAITATALAPLH